MSVMTRGKQLTPEDEAKILDMYARGIPRAEIGHAAGIHPGSVSKILQRNGVKANRKPDPFTDEARERVKELYGNGMNGHEIARQLGCHFTSVYDALERAGVDRRQRIACDNPGYFDRIDTPDKAYWLGFIGADGCVTGFERGHPYLSIGLARKDRDHLVTLAGALQANRPIRDHEQLSYGKVRLSSRLRVSSPQLVHGLVRHGIVPRKTDVLVPWDGPASLMPHYWRGMVDGDGWVSAHKRRVRVGLVGSEGCVKAFGAWANALTGSRAKPFRRGNCMWEVGYIGTTIPRLLLAALYNDAPVALARKAAQATQALEKREDAES